MKDVQPEMLNSASFSMDATWPAGCLQHFLVLFDIVQENVTLNLPLSLHIWYKAYSILSELLPDNIKEKIKRSLIFV